MSEVRQLAKGKWHGLLSMLCCDEKFLSGKHGPCPMCGGKDRWRFTDHDGEGRWICNTCGNGDGFELLERMNGWDFATAAKEVERVVGTIKEGPRRPKVDPSKRIERIKVGLQKHHDAVDKYLHSRGLSMVPSLRAHPMLSYYDSSGKHVGDYPAMVAGIQAPDGKLVSLHLTYLDDDGGKAPVEAPRKVVTPDGSLDGGAVRLQPREERMGVAEGIETALAASVIFRMPVWATVNTTIMEKWQLPPGVKWLTIFADRDRNYAGERAAYTLAHKIASKGGVAVDVAVPPMFGDWNDVLLERL